LETTDPATGKRRQVSKGGFRTKAAAIDALDDARSTHRQRGFVEPRKLTVRAFLLDEWLPTVNRRPSTVASYKWLVERYIVPRIGGLMLLELTPKHVRDLADDLATSGAQGGGPLSTRTVNYTLTLVRMAMRHAVSNGLLRRDPTGGIVRKPPDPNEVGAWTAEEASAFLASVEDDRLYALWLLLLARGPRRGEVCGLSRGPATSRRTQSGCPRVAPTLPRCDASRAL
jgi:integrase